MRRAIATAMVLAAGAAPAAAGDAKPRIVSAAATPGPDRSVTLRLVARDPDGVVRGMDVEWGDGAAQGMSTCEIPNRRRPGRKVTLRLGYAYAAAGAYRITVQVYSGGCGKRRQQRSAPRTLAVRVG